VLVNLAINARDAMPSGGRLEIGTSDVVLDAPEPFKHGADVPPGRYVVVTVSDEGTGMDQQTMGKIFEPFFTTKAVGKGTGLGLATCYGIIHQAGGHILVDSSPGRGATFRVFLPHVLEAAQPSSQVPPPMVLEGSETILVAEDDAQVRRLTVRALEGYGYTVVEAESGERALGLLDAGAAIDLLLTDVVMKGMSGKALGERVTAAHPTVRVVYMSGYAPDATEGRGVHEGEDAMLRKPFTPDSLARVVRAALAAPRGRG
jgi:two-component system, cell cycle sensor histidine kinase and response regulator CckA